MGVYANGHLIYGYIRDENTDALFTAIEECDDADDKELEEEEEELELSFEEHHMTLQEQCKISLYGVGYENVDIISAYSISTSAKNFAYENVPFSDFTKTDEYDANLHAFFTALGIDTTPYPAGWILLGYMD